MVVYYFTILETLPSGTPRDGVGHLFRKFVRTMAGQALVSFWKSLQSKLSICIKKYIGCFGDAQSGERKEIA